MKKAPDLLTRVRAEQLLRQRHPERAITAPWIREGATNPELDDLAVAEIVETSADDGAPR